MEILVVKLYAPDAYWALTQKQREEVTGGCGPGKYGDYLIPDTIWFLSIREACRIHDFMYRIGATLEDKMEADRVFMNNMLRIITTSRYEWVKNLRRSRARKYYLIVKHFGGPTYWRGKNKPAEEDLVVV